MTAKELNKIATTINQDRPSFLKEEAESNIRLIEDALERAANKGRLSRDEFLRTELLDYMSHYFDDLKSRGFTVEIIKKDDFATLSVSWAAV